MHFSMYESHKKKPCFSCFQQAKYEFINEGMPMEEIESDDELSCLKSESLGMAVLHLSHLAVETGCTLQEVDKRIR